jgi:2-methylcitrate dehydratase PrpD
MPDNLAVTAQLAQFVDDTQWDALSPLVIHQAKRALVNFFAVALIGCREPAIEITLRSLATFAGAKQATVIGRGERLDALSAAFLNAASANVLDFCDTHVPTVIHPTAPLAPALFALGELRRITGRNLILAFVLGAEIECRIGLAISPSHYRRGWHITATCGIFGAAAGSCKLLALKANRSSARSASLRRKPRGSANASARGPKAFMSATQRATDCGRRYWRRMTWPAPPSRSPAARAISMRWPRRHSCRVSPSVSAMAGKS